MYRLAGLNPALPLGPGHDLVHPSLLRLLDAFPLAAAYVLGPAFDVLATNRIADALLSPFDEERNMPRILFTHPQAKTVFAQWPVVAAATVDALRLNAGRFPEDQNISGLVAELTERSDEFRSGGHHRPSAHWPGHSRCSFIRRSAGSS